MEKYFFKTKYFLENYKDVISENIKEEIADVMFNTSQLIQALLSRDLITPEDFHNTATEQKKKIYLLEWR